jgi:predicted ATPase
VPAAQADVVQPAVVPQGEFAVGVDLVVADPEVAVDERDAGGGGLGPGCVGLGRGAPVQRPVRPEGVVVDGEGVELGLQLVEVGGAGLPGQPPLLRLVEALDLAAGLWVVGPGVAEDHAAGVEGELEGDPSAAAVAAGEDRAVVAEHPGRVAVPPLATASEVDGWEEIAACEAVRLFAERASAARPGFAVTPANAALVLEVFRRLDGLPLALELAAARIASMPLRALAERLDDRFRLLDPIQRPAGDRHHSLAAAMAWSHDLLPEPERLLFARVSMFPASFTLAAADDVAAQDLAGADAATLLGRLVSGSTLQLEDGPDGEGRYRMLETTRQYGRERLDARALATLRERHARHYLACAQQAEPHLLSAGSAPWLTRLHTEHDNFRAALEWAFSADGDPLVGARLIACLWHPWDLRGLRGEGLHWVGAGLQAVGADRPLERLPLLSAGALFHLGRGEFAAVAELTVEQLALARATTTPAWQGDVLASDATVAWARGQFDRAQQLYEDAVAASLAGGDHWRAATAEAQLARLHRDRDEPDAARAIASRARDHAEEVGEALARGLSIDVLASVEQRWGDAAAARRLVADALTHYRELGYLEGEASAHHVAGRIALGSSDLMGAKEAFGHSLRLCRRIGHRGGSAAALEGLADAAADAGDDERAVLFLGAASALRDEIGTPLTGSAGAQRLELRRRLVDRLGPELVDRILRRGARLRLDVLLDDARSRSVRA